MKTNVFQVILMAVVSTVIAIPPGLARGGGFGGGGHFGGGGFGGGGGGRSFGGGGFGGGGSRSFGGGGGRDFGGGGSRDFGGGGSRDFGGGGSRDFGGGGSMSGGGFGGRGSSGHDFGGGFNSLGGHTGGFDNHGGMGGGGQGFENRGGQGFDNHGNFGQGGNRPDQPISGHGNFPDGFSGISGLQNRTPHNINQNNLNKQGSSVRNSFNNNSINHNNQFNQTNNYSANVNRYGGGYGGYGNHPYGAGYAHGWGASNAYHGYWGGAGCWGYGGSEAAMWTCMGLTSLTTFLGMGMMGAAMAGGSNKGNNSAPASTTNVTYQGDTVYVNGQPSGSSAQYYQQAQQLAAQAYAQGQSDAYASQQASSNGSYPPLAPAITNQASSQSQDWAPLGVFALAEPGQQQSNMMLQLAINKQGVLRGNYLNQLTNERSQVYGALDKSTQRISWTIGQNNSTVFDTTIGDLTKEDSQVLVHYGPTNTQEMALIRLQAPADSGQNAGSPDPSSFPAPAPGA